MPDLVGPLRGLRVLDLADEKGLYCTKLLADLGADVIKIEPREGDPARRLGPFLDDDPSSESLYWLHFNTNKKSVTLDLGAAKGRELFRRLCTRSDVVVETSPPGEMERMGAGWGTLRELNPGLILASITSFGQEGPWRNFKASDLVGMALGGLLSSCGWPDNAPEKIGGLQACHMASVQAAVGILMAVYERARTKRGRHVDVSMHASIPVTLMVSVPVYEKTGAIMKRGWDWNTDPANGIFPCADGYIDFRLRLQRWNDLVNWLDEDGMAGELKEEEWKDPWYRQTTENTQKINEIFGRFLTRHPKKYLYEEGQARGFEVGPVNTISEVAGSPQLRKRRFFAEVDHPELGKALEYVGPPFRSSQAPWRLVTRAPALGEHNRQVYLEELGLLPDEFARLVDSRVI